MILYNFYSPLQADEWIVVDDVVMGGKSRGNFMINPQGKGVFEGNVSLENNGGRPPPTNLEHVRVTLRL